MTEVELAENTEGPGQQEVDPLRGEPSYGLGILGCNARGELASGYFLGVM